MPWTEDTCQHGHPSKVRPIALDDVNVGSSSYPTGFLVRFAEACTLGCAESYGAPFVQGDGKSAREALLKKPEEGSAVVAIAETASVPS